MSTYHAISGRASAVLSLGACEDWQRNGARGGLLLHRNVQRFRGGLVFKAHRRCASLNSRRESNKEEEKKLKIAEPIGRSSFLLYYSQA